jgi:hypothetical protein
MPSTEKTMRFLEEHIPELAQSAVTQAYWQALASGSKQRVGKRSGRDLRGVPRRHAHADQNHYPAQPGGRGRDTGDAVSETPRPRMFAGPNGSAI